MDERRDPEPDAGRRPTLPPPSVRLSPVQTAWQRYVTHSLRQCDTCQAADGSPCDTAEALYADYQRIGNAGLDQMGGAASLPHGQ